MAVNYNTPRLPKAWRAAQPSAITVLYRKNHLDMIAQSHT
jgi:hypothetical protein